MRPATSSVSFAQGEKFKRANSPPRKWGVKLEGTPPQRPRANAKSKATAGVSTLLPLYPWCSVPTRWDHQGYPHEPFRKTTPLLVEAARDVVLASPASSGPPRGRPGGHVLPGVGGMNPAVRH